MKLYIKTTTPGKFVKVELRYSLGNYLAYQATERGYYLYVTPVEREDRDGVTIESYSAFSGYKYLVHAVNRRSAKQERIAEEKAKDIYPGMVQRVAAEHGLTVLMDD